MAPSELDWKVSTSTPNSEPSDFHGTVDVVQRVGSVDLGFPTPEPAEVGTVDKCDAHDHISMVA